jgi:hypothetical protein
MKQDWVKAAERYEAAKQPGFKPRKKRAEENKPPVTLASFLANGEGEAARKLLAASEQDICLGYSETVMSRTASVVLDGDGLKRVCGIVGVAAAYTTEKPTHEAINTVTAMQMLRQFPEDGNMLDQDDRYNEQVIVEAIRKRLDAIAAEAP